MLPDTNVERMRTFIEEVTPTFMREGKIPGFSIAVVYQNEVIYAEGFGVRDIERNLPATPGTLYGIGSITKSFVAIAILQLVEKGVIELEDPVDRYVPLKIGLSGKPITIHHLLTHSSGIPSLATSSIALSRGVGEDMGVPWGGVNDFYRLLNGSGDEIVDEPGRRFFYFNAGYRMLGHIIQKVTETTFDAYITENIVKPLNMKRTTLSRARYEADPDRMTPYWKKPDGIMKPTDFPYPNVNENPDFSFIAAAGGIISPVNELTRYLIANMNGGRYGNTQILNSEYIKRMQNLYVERPPQHFGRYGYGYGWSVTENFFGHKMVSHGGSILVSTAHLAFIPQLNIGVAMASNTMGFPHATVAHGVLAALIGKEPEKAIPALTIRARMKLLTGNYEIYQGLDHVKVMKKEGLLYLEERTPFTDTSVPLIPEDDCLASNKFYTLSEGVKTPIEFVVESPENIDLFVERYRYHKISS